MMNTLKGLKDYVVRNKAGVIATILITTATTIYTSYKSERDLRDAVSNEVDRRCAEILAEEAAKEAAHE